MMSEKINEVNAYENCVTHVKHVFESDPSDMDSTTKYNAITQIMRKYYLSEDVRIVFEGFLHLFIEFYNFATKLKSSRDDSLAIQAMQTFSDYYAECEPFDQDIIAESFPENNIYVRFFKASINN